MMNNMNHRECYVTFCVLLIVDITNVLLKTLNDLQFKSVEYFPCQNCGETFLDYEELNNHFSKNHE